jgi:putative NIF3 family GTP cyclohydrolase 1 type 2
LAKYCHQYLQVDKFTDYCPNGLQIQGKSDIKKISTPFCLSVANSLLAFGALNKIKQTTLAKYCHQYLQVDKFTDYCPNGLQIQGKSDIKKIISGE